MPFSPYSCVTVWVIPQNINLYLLFFNVTKVLLIDSSIRHPAGGAICCESWAQRTSSWKRIQPPTIVVSKLKKKVWVGSMTVYIVYYISVSTHPTGSCWDWSVCEVVVSYYSSAQTCLQAFLPSVLHTEAQSVLLMHKTQLPLLLLVVIKHFMNKRLHSGHLHCCCTQNLRLYPSTEVHLHLINIS